MLARTPRSANFGRWDLGLMEMVGAGDEGLPWVET